MAATGLADAAEDEGDLMLQLGGRVSGNLDLGRFCRAVSATFSANKQGSRKWGGRPRSSKLQGELPTRYLR
ncbi:hypothetical protein CCMA1212_010720 [Trichoderma ghanense]|uniref:Uncharacterized protein n=1 Tax=Trichoderma ghanense TaxID=65468 RepID=A0ABY2GPQ3_9HYPO